MVSVGEVYSNFDESIWFYWFKVNYSGGDMQYKRDYN